jgi:hypothetical protein
MGEMLSKYSPLDGGTHSPLIKCSYLVLNSGRAARVDEGAADVATLIICGVF